MISEKIGRYDIDMKTNSSTGGVMVYVYLNKEYIGKDYGLLDYNYARASAKRIIAEFEVTNNGR